MAKTQQELYDADLQERFDYDFDGNIDTLLEQIQSSLDCLDIKSSIFAENYGFVQQDIEVYEYVKSKQKELDLA